MRQQYPQHGAHGCNGFTLLEIMIALAIISIALIALLGLANRSIGVHDRLHRITEATLLAQEKMAETEISAQHGDLVINDSEGVFEEPFEDFRWTIVFADTPLSSVKMVTVTVLWGNKELNDQVDLTSFIF